MRHWVFALFRRSDHDRTLVIVCLTMWYTAVIILIKTFLEWVFFVEITFSSFTFTFWVYFKVITTRTNILTFWNPILKLHFFTKWVISVLQDGNRWDNVKMILFWGFFFVWKLDINFLPTLAGWVALIARKFVQNLLVHFWGRTCFPSCFVHYATVCLIYYFQFL